MTRRQRVAAAAMLGAVLLSALGTVRPVHAAPPGFVTRSGAQLLLNGSPYRFKGFNIYGANSRQGTSGTAQGWTNAGFVCGDDFTPPKLDQSLTQIGQAANAARSWFFQDFVTVNGARDWTAFDQTLAAYAAHNVKVIVTFGASQGSCDFPAYADYNWYVSGYKSTIPSGYTETYYNFVRDVVTRYSGHSEVLMWQLFNEASLFNCPSEAQGATTMRSWADDVSGLIKSIDPNHLVSLGTGLPNGPTGYGCGYRTDATTGGVSDYQYVHAGANIDLCEYHDYSQPTDALPSDMSAELQACANLGKPLFVGELGIVIGNAGWDYGNGNKINADPTDPTRQKDLKAKLDAQYGAGSVGELVWEYGIAVCDQFCVHAGDPELTTMSAY